MGGISWGGVFSCAAAATLWGMSLNSGRDANTLRSVRRLSTLKELAKLLEDGGRPLPVVVAAAGRVGSEQPISCDHSSLRGVILEETAEQHFLKHNESGSWVQDSAVMLSTSKEVPWYLEDGTGRVYVLGARGATGLELTVASEVFEESGRSLVRGTLDYLQGLKARPSGALSFPPQPLPIAVVSMGQNQMLGVKRVERVLPIGSALTVVGEAVKDDRGVFRIQRPHKGPFYVSPKGLEQLISNLGKWGKFYRWLSLGWAAFGIYLIGSHAIRHHMERRRRKAIQRRVMEAATGRGNSNDAEDNEGEAREGEGGGVDGVAKGDRLTPDLCVICLEEHYNAVFVPCGHMCCCTSCTVQLNNCPLCRRRIEQVVKCYRH